MSSANVRSRIAARTVVRAALTATLTRLAGDGKGSATLPVVRGPARGLRLEIDLRHDLPVVFGSYEAETVRLVSRICRPGWTVWDCGAYAGFYTTLFARLVGPGGRVVCFEPDPRNLSRTRANVERNRFANVTFVPAAIGAGGGDTSFILSEGTNSHLPGTYIGVSPEEYRPREQMGEVIQVPCLSLDEALAREDLGVPHLIKLDIDGAERDALAHADRLARGAGPLIVLELHNPECDEAAWQFAWRNGYALRHVETGGLVLRRKDAHGRLLCVPPIR